MLAGLERTGPAAPLDDCALPEARRRPARAAPTPSPSPHRDAGRLEKVGRRCDGSTPRTLQAATAPDPTGVVGVVRRDPSTSPAPPRHRRRHPSAVDASAGRHRRARPEQRGSSTRLAAAPPGGGCSTASAPCSAKKATGDRRFSQRHGDVACTRTPGPGHVPAGIGIRRWAGPGRDGPTAKVLPRLARASNDRPALDPPSPPTPPCHSHGASYGAVSRHGRRGGDRRLCARGREPPSRARRRTVPAGRRPMRRCAPCDLARDRTAYSSYQLEVSSGRAVEEELGKAVPLFVASGDYRDRCMAAARRLGVRQLARSLQRAPQTAHVEHGGLARTTRRGRGARRSSRDRRAGCRREARSRRVRALFEFLRIDPSSCPADADRHRQPPDWSFR